MGIWKKFIAWNKKSRRRELIAQANLNHFSREKNLKCPKCKKFLYELIGKGTHPPYVCRNCKYIGPIGL